MITLGQLELIMFIMIILTYFLWITLPYSSAGHLRILMYHYTKRNQLKGFWVFTLLLLILAVGMRDTRVGLDTSGYANMYNTVQFVQQGSIEYGYQCLEWLASKLGLNYGMFFLLTASISIAPIIYLIYTESNAPWLSFLIYFGSTLYPWTFSAVRQMIALGLIAIAYRFAVKQKPALFIVAVFFAAMFHKTALIFLPVYLFNIAKINRKFIVCALAVGGTILTFKTQIMDFLQRYARISYGAIEVGGERYALVLFATAIMGCLFYKRFQESKMKIAMYCCIALPFLYLLVQTNPSLFRLTWYYQILLVIFVPNCLSAIDERWIRTCGYLIYSALFGYMFVAQVLLQDMQMVEYHSWLFR